MLDSSASDKRIENFDHQLTQKRQVRFKTCGDVYNYWRSCKRLYKKAPKDGVEFQVEYIDTGLALDEKLREKAPIALALHGAPGSYHDFALLIRHLSKQNVRVIAPNFPEYIATVKTKVLFRHSADEKAAYLRDFLNAINVNRIDLLVSHSSAIFPTLLILLNANNQAIAKRRQQDNSNNEQQGKHQQPQSQSQQDADNQMIISSLRNLTIKENDNGLNGTSVGNNANKLLGAANNGQLNSCGKGDVANTSKDEEGADADEEEEDDELDDNGEDEEEFEDAKDEVNNNNNYHLDRVNKGQDDENAFERQEDESNQRSSEHSQPEHINKRLDKKGRRGKNRSKRRSSGDVIVKFEQPIEIKAVALLNPAGHRLPKSMKPTWFKCGSCRIYQHKLGRSLFRKLGPAFLTVIGVPVKVDNMDNVMLSATVMRNSKCQRVVRQLEQLSELKMPTLLVFSENDKLIEKEIFYEMTQFMKLDQKNFDIFNNDGDIEISQSLKKDWIRVMVFKAGGHYAYSNYANTVNKAVSELLQRVIKVPADVEAAVESC